MTISDEDLAHAKRISVEQVALLRMSRGCTNETLEGLPEASVHRALRRLEYPDLPTARGMFRLAQERGDDGQVPAHALTGALDQLHAALEADRPARFTAGVPTGLADAEGRTGPSPTAGMSLTAWDWLGPGNIGGRTRGLVIDPERPDRMWAASAGGGVWHTEDGGGEWQPVDDFLGNLACACIAQDPARPATLYVGTGEGFSNGDALRGNGLFTTTDTVTWAPVDATQTPDFRFVSRIAVSSTGEVLLAATNSGVFRSADPGRATWTPVLTGVAVADVKFHPADDRLAVAGSMRAGEAWFSRDGGRTWVTAGRGPWEGRVELAYAAADPGTVYASVEMSRGGQIWRSTDGGETYEPRKTRDPAGRTAAYLGDQGWYDNAIWAGDPTDADLVLVGGIDLWRSTDGGDSVAEISTWWEPRSVHADHHAIVSHPGYDGRTNRTVFFGNDGGVFKADDLFAVGTEDEPPFVRGWTELVNNYGATQFYGGAGHTAGGKIIGGAQDNGTLVFDPALGTERWREFFGGDGGWCAADPDDENVFYGEYVFLNIHRSTDGGATDDTRGDRYISGQFFNPVVRDWDWKPVPFRIPDAKNRQAEFIAPFVMDPNNPQRLLAGGRSLWVTDDAKTRNTPGSGPRWRAIKGNAGSLITALAVSPRDSDVIWVGHEDGLVFRTTEGTNTAPAWDRVGATGARRLEPRRYCTGLTAHPDDPDTVYATFGGFEPGNLWVTRDGGAEWTDLAGGLPAVPVRALAVHPGRPGFLYCGTEIGLFASEDEGATWSPTNEGPTNCSVDDLFWMDRTLVCVTHGRGMFRIDLSDVA
ncbi:WD40/YVTN/BNR-like repeat-containing protein [Streptomyces sp. NPDC052773]|uniref:WD40/YVTN/BNR-like repeat-containing protein n=1 Tax=Streptomyces sp. NPDC052773 TaxID=3365693 RepID=UPI0037CE348C